jgi:hypothetical protein
LRKAASMADSVIAANRNWTPRSVKNRTKTFRAGSATFLSTMK